MKSPISAEALRYWADMGDNRIGPILAELVEAILEEDDPSKLTKLGNRLKFMSSSVISYRDRLSK